MGKKDYKSIIEKILKFLITREKFNNEPFKVRAYEKVLVQIEDLDHVYSEADLKDVQGIGVKIRSKLEEIFTTGTYSKYVETDLSLAYKDLLQIYGIGPKKAKDLINKGIYSIADLKKKLEETPDLLNESQLLGLEYYDDSIERIPREEIDLHSNYLKIEARRFELKSEIAGSYRRKMPTSGDIDCLIHYENLTPKNSVTLFNELIDDLVLSGYIIGILSRGDKKCLCFCKIKDKVRRIDLLLTTKEEYPFALLYFTGSKQFNISMRKLALEKGYSLSEHSLTKISTKKKVSGLKNEKDIFEFLEMTYVSPSKRV
jgi:DNA polymerase/3'-5' exonuclease PolX